MTYRISRKNTSSTFRVGKQLCKVTFVPWYEYRPGYWIWNVGFAVGQSRRQLNDWYYKRKVIDAGINGTGYCPISYQQLKKIMNSKTISPVDHHK